MVHIIDTGLVARIYKEPLQINKKTTSNSIGKKVSDFNKDFMREDTQRADKHIKSRFTELVVEEMQNKTTVQSSYTTRMAKI